ncbi:MAG: hypothetical protein FJ286_12610 [Planctomycetes bacterium]|nr:hypothetical protein [Planctomycetota bacterium]
MPLSEDAIALGLIARRGPRVVCAVVAALLLPTAANADRDSFDPQEEPRAVPERIALLPPVEFNLEEDTFSSAPIADADPEAGTRRPRPGGGPFGSAAPVSLGGFWAPPTAVVRQPGELGMNAQFARHAIPLVPPQEGAPLWIGIGRFGRLELSTDAILPDSRRSIPDQLWLVETGLTHIRPLEHGGSLGGTFLFGSASDQPFAAGRDLTLMAIGFWNTPARDARDEWNFSLFYSPTSQLPYPLPGIAYAWRPSPTLEARIGVPASIEWRPDERWTLSAAWFPLVNVAVEARRRITDDWALLAFYRTDTQIYFLADRLLDSERLYVFDQRAAMGLERRLGRGFSLEAVASWLFDREIFQGTSFTSGRTDVVEFGSGPGLSLQLLWRR